MVKHPQISAAEDAAINRGIALDPDNPEWSEKDFANAQPFAERFPELTKQIEEKRKGVRGKQVAPTKKPVTMRLDPDVLEFVKSGGKGWQSRLNAKLRELKEEGVAI